MLPPSPPRSSPSQSSCSDRYGRTKTIAAASGLFIAGGVIMATATSFSALLVGRMVVGVGVGIGISIDPLYVDDEKRDRGSGR